MIANVEYAYTRIRQDESGFAAYGSSEKVVIVKSTLQNGVETQTFYQTADDSLTDFETAWANRATLTYTFLPPRDFFKIAPATAAESNSGGGGGFAPAPNPKAIATNGIDDFLNLASNYNLQPNKNWTLAFWFKTTERNGDLVSKGFGGNDGNHQLRIYFRYGTLNTVVGGRRRSIGRGYDNNQWHHLVITNKLVNSVWTFTPYLNAIPFRALNSGTKKVSTDFIIAARRRDTTNSQVENHIEAIFDDIIHFENALSEIEINALYSPLGYASPRTHSRYSKIKNWIDGESSISQYPDLVDAKSQNVRGTIMNAQPNFENLVNDTPAI